MPKAQATAATTVTTAKTARPPVPAKKVAPAKPSSPAETARKVAKAPQAAATPKAEKAAKPRQKPVRDSFTMPATDFALIAALKSRLLAAKRVAKKSELLRAGLHALAGLDTAALVAALGKLDQVKVGRPKKGH